MPDFGDCVKSWIIDQVSVFLCLMSILSNNEHGLADLLRSKFNNTRSQMVLRFPRDPINVCRAPSFLIQTITIRNIS